MENNKVIVQDEFAHSPLMRSLPDRTTKNRVLTFLRWAGDKWLVPDLEGYKNYLLIERGYKKTTASSHLSSLRARYYRLMLNRDFLYTLVPADVTDKTERFVYVEELERRIRNAIDPKRFEFSAETKQDVADSEHLRLTVAQAQDFLKQPDRSTLIGVRDSAMIAVLLCTGIREFELKALAVDDLRQSVEGELCLRVKRGKGEKQRLVPYGKLSWCLSLVDQWLSQAGISNGPVFRAFTSKKRDKVKDTGISLRSIENAIKSYSVESLTVRPHDLRRTYARTLYESGLGLKAIQENLGHNSMETTLKYIGVSNMKNRTPGEVYGGKE